MTIITIITIITVLSGIWGIGCAVGLLVALWRTYNDGEYVIAALVFFLGGPLLALFAILPWAFIADSVSPTLDTLKKGEWVCTDSHTVVTSVPISTGHSTTFMPQSYKVCNTYTRL
jgi:hypothetical protein